jgi:Carbohydrate binding module (family 6)
VATHSADGDTAGGDSADRDEDTTQEVEEAPEGRRRGLRPLVVIALCAVVSVSAVWVTKTVDQRWSGYGTPAVAGPVDATSSTAAGSTSPPASPSSTVDAAAGSPSATPAPPTKAAAIPVPVPDPRKTTSAPVPVPSPTTPGVQPVVSYEAESVDNTKAGTTTYACAPCSGGQKVGEVGNGTVLTFNAVDAVVTGTVRLTVSYVNGGATRTATMSVDGGAPVSLTFPPTGGWSSVGTLVVTVSLHAGGNTVAFANATAFAPDFDRLTVSPAIG